MCDRTEKLFNIRIENKFAAAGKVSQIELTENINVLTLQPNIYILLQIHMQPLLKSSILIYEPTYRPNDF